MGLRECAYTEGWEAVGMPNDIVRNQGTIEG
jgi:hypothetical protein